MTKSHSSPDSRGPPGDSRPVSVVGIGSSAGGLDAFTQLLIHLPHLSGMAFVLVQHLDPTHDSHLTDILSKSTAMPVLEVKDGMAVARNHVYVIPPNASMAIAGGVLHLSRRSETRGTHMPIDFFLRSLAQDRQGHAIGVVLSGTGSDGTLGLAEIKAAGGITFAQDDASAKYPGMPQSAVAEGVVDVVLSPGDIARELARIGNHAYFGRAGPEDGDVPFPDGEGGFARIIALLRSHSGVDFAHYRDSTLKRRILRRMVLGRREILGDYVRHLEADESEITALYQDILIHVTRFFRDPKVFQSLAEVVLPLIRKAKSPGETIRAWVAGCATGEEAYSLAIALCESQDGQEVRFPLRVFASDIGESPSLEKARTGAYSGNIEHDVSPERLRRFFVKQDGGYRVNKELREMCIFARHDVTADPPFARLDLISCRNVLIYLSAPLQRRIIPAFHYALNPGGFLLLGSSETIGNDTDLFSPVDPQLKIYAKKMAAPRLPIPAAKDNAAAAPAKARSTRRQPSSLDFQQAADRLLLRKFVPPGVLVNKDGDVLQFRGRTSPFLEPPQGGIGLNLDKMAQESLSLELRHAIRESASAAAAVVRRDVRVLDGRTVRRVDVEIVPVRLPDAAEPCFVVLFEASQDQAVLLPPAAPRDQGGPPEDEEVSLLRLELAAAREYLQTIRERCEAVNEELKSSNEEMESSNEELQSTNEELETAKEELQSANEELSILNEELGTRNLELARLNDDLSNVQQRLQESADFARSIVDTVREPLVILDGDLRIHSANLSYYRLFGASPQDTEGRLLPDVAGGRWRVPELLDLLRKQPDTDDGFEGFEVSHDLPAGRETLVLNARRLLHDDGRTRMRLLAIEDITGRRRAEEALRRSEERLRQAQRMEAIGKLAGGVAHDFNNLLTAINGYSALCLEAAPEAGDMHDYLEEIRKAGERAAGLTRQLLAYSRKQVLTAKVLDLNVVVSNMHSMLARLIGERFHLTLSLGVPLGLVKADPGQIEQVLINLVVNARDALPGGGEITLGTRNQELSVDGPESLPQAAAGAYVVLSVGDEGIGMDAELQKRIFEPFFTTKGFGADSQGRTGTGLGLSVVQGIISQSGGHILVKSEPGGGSVFEIFLPMEDIKHTPAVRQDESGSPPLRGTETVLLVEDEDTVRHFTRKVLEMQGYSVLEADNGRNAMAVNERHKDAAIHILVTDMVMPGIGGHELAEMFLASRPESRVLFMSGYTEDAIFRQDGIAGRAANFIQKPFKPSELAKAVRNILDLVPQLPPPIKEIP